MYQTEKNNEINMNVALDYDGKILATSFNQFLQKSTEAIIQMATIVVKARKLSPVEQDIFYSKIRYKKDSKAIIKLQKIGERADFFTSYSTYLPCNWTTLYTLTQLSDEKLVELITDNKIHQSLTGVEAQELVNSLTNIQPSSERNQKKEALNKTQLADDSYSIAIQFQTIPSANEANELKHFIDEFTKKTKCTFLFSAFFEELLVKLDSYKEMAA